MLSILAIKAFAGALSGALLALPLSAVAAAPLDSMPDRSWLGVKEVLVVAELVVPGGSPSEPLTAAELCNKVRQIASTGSPYPVTCTQLGDPKLLRGDAAVLVIQASIRSVSGHDPLLIYTIRRQNSAGLEPGPLYFGSIPQAVPIADAGGVDTALRNSLGEVLPWLRAPETILKPLPKRESK